MDPGSNSGRMELNTMNKYTTVVVITVLFGFLFALGGWFYYWMFTEAAFPGLLKALIVVLTVGVIVALVYVASERIKELRKEEEDDLSQY